MICRANIRGRLRLKLSIPFILTAATTQVAWAQDGGSNPAPVAEDTRLHLPAPHVYDDEPPLDYPQRVWSYRTRLWRPRRFARREFDSRFGRRRQHFDHHGRFGGYPHSGYHGSYHYYGGFATDAYLQGRHDERRFQDWAERHEYGLRVYLSAMQNGVAHFQNAHYPQALRSFLLAVGQHQGEPAPRLYAVYCMVAMGKYDQAVPMLRRAIELQSRLFMLPLDIRDEYGAPGDFDQHLAGLRAHVNDNPDEHGLWMLLGFYQHFSDDPAGADASLLRASALAPHDRLIERLAETTRLLAPAGSSR